MKGCVCLLSVLIGLAGCDQLANMGGSKSSDGSGTTDPEVQLVLDLSAAGRAYHNHIDTHGKGPADLNAFRAFAAQGGEDAAFLDRLQANGYNFTWGFDPRAGVPMSTTVMAQSSQKAPQLMMDSSLANVTPELLERAREARKKKSSSKSSSSKTASVPVDPNGLDLPQPTSPLEMATRNYLVQYHLWLLKLGEIQDMASARRVQPELRAMDRNFDLLGEQLGKHGMQVDFLAVPQQYKPALQQVQSQQTKEDNRLGGLPEAKQINEFLMADYATQGPLGPARTVQKIQEAFNASRGNNPAPNPNTSPRLPGPPGFQPAPGTPPLAPPGVTTKGLPPTVSGTTPFKAGDKVDVMWGNSWYPAAVLQTKGDHCLIRYDNYDATWDEWVPPSRIRARAQ